MRLMTDCNGMVCGADVEIFPAGERSAMTGTDNSAGLYEEEWAEQIIDEGMPCTGRVLMNVHGQGVLQSEDASENAGVVGGMVIDVLESGGCSAGQYGELFGSAAFQDFCAIDWEQAGKGWTADRFYDCYYTGASPDTEKAGFLFCIYPDFDKMMTDAAPAVTFRCGMDPQDGRISYTELLMCGMAKEECQAAREWIREDVPVIVDGDVAGGSSDGIHYAEVPLAPVFLEDYLSGNHADAAVRKEFTEKRINDVFDPYFLEKLSERSLQPVR